MMILSSWARRFEVERQKRRKIKLAFIEDRAGKPSFAEATAGEAGEASKNRLFINQAFEKVENSI